MKNQETCVIPTFYLCLRITDLMAQTGQFVIPVGGIRELFYGGVGGKGKPSG